MRRGVLIYNPAAGGMRFEPRLAGIIERARTAGIELDAQPTTAPGSATQIVRRALASRPDLIVAAGGDGTMGEVAAGLVGSPIPLAMLPVGTANVLAREYGVGTTLRDAERILSSHKTRPLTAWRAGESIFFMWLGVGLDARVMKHTIPALKRTFGRVGIAWTALIESLRYDFPAIAVEGTDARGNPFSREATFVVASNIRRYGGEPQLSPMVDPESDLLDLTLFTGRSTAALARFFLDIALGRAKAGKLADAEQFHIRTLTARSLRGAEVDFQLDGAVVGITPISVPIALGHVQIVVPGSS